MELLKHSVETNIVEFYDPLAQSFTVDETGAFLTKLDVYFASKDENEKIRCELRTVELGTPTAELVTEYSQVTLEPKDIQTSADASVRNYNYFPITSLSGTRS